MQIDKAKQESETLEKLHSACIKKNEILYSLVEEQMHTDLKEKMKKNNQINLIENHVKSL